MAKCYICGEEVEAGILSMVNHMEAAHTETVKMKTTITRKDIEELNEKLKSYEPPRDIFLGIIGGSMLYYTPGKKNYIPRIWEDWMNDVLNDQPNPLGKDE